MLVTTRVGGRVATGRGGDNLVLLPVSSGQPPAPPPPRHTRQQLKWCTALSPRGGAMISDAVRGNMQEDITRLTLVSGGCLCLCSDSVCVCCAHSSLITQHRASTAILLKHLFCGHDFLTHLYVVKISEISKNIYCFYNKKQRDPCGNWRVVACWLSCCSICCWVNWD